jgi:hypothetical protein
MCVDGIMLPCHLPTHRPLETFYDSVLVQLWTNKLISSPLAPWTLLLPCPLPGRLGIIGKEVGLISDYQLAIINNKI